MSQPDQVQLYSAANNLALSAYTTQDSGDAQERLAIFDAENHTVTLQTTEVGIFKSKDDRSNNNVFKICDQLNDQRSNTDTFLEDSNARFEYVQKQLQDTESNTLNDFMDSDNPDTRKSKIMSECEKSDNIYGDVEVKISNINYKDIPSHEAKQKRFVTKTKKFIGTKAVGQHHIYSIDPGSELVMYQPPDTMDGSTPQPENTGIYKEYFQRFHDLDSIKSVEANRISYENKLCTEIEALGTSFFDTHVLDQTALQKLTDCDIDHLHNMYNDLSFFLGEMENNRTNARKDMLARIEEVSEDFKQYTAVHDDPEKTMKTLHDIIEAWEQIDTTTSDNIGKVQTDIDLLHNAVLDVKSYLDTFANQRSTM